MRRLINIFVNIIILHCGFGQNFEGDACVGRLQVQGICRIITDCPKVQEDLKKGLRPVTCGYVNLKAVVCCPLISIVTEVTYTEAQKQTKRYRKCDEYKSAVYERIYEQSLVANAKPIERETDQCGHTAVPLIVGGTRAGLKEFPHSAMLGYRTLDNTISWDCGGSLISKRYVLTAAHCLISQNYGPVEIVRLGELDHTSEYDNAKPKNYHISERILHPNYNRTRYNDIALLKLNESVAFNPHIRPICLPVTSDVPKKGIATGWGATDWAGEFSTTLLKVTLETYSQTECNTTYMATRDRKLPNGIVNTQLCAGSRIEAKDTCQGDSGGPFQIYHPTLYCMYTQVGVTSYGMACGGINTPGVYTNIASYVDWIEKNVWPDGQTIE